MTTTTSNSNRPIFFFDILDLIVILLGSIGLYTDTQWLISIALIILTIKLLWFMFLDNI